MQKFVAEESFWELFPQASIGVVVARGMKGKDEVPASDAAEIARLLSDANERAKAYLTSETISELSLIHILAEVLPLFPNTMDCTLTAVPRSSAILFCLR